MKSYIMLAITTLAAVFLSSCAFPFSMQPGANRLRCDIPYAVGNLDPQFSADPYARMILANIGEGLVRINPDGTVIPGAAQQYTVSPDGTVYTFHLRKSGGRAGKEPQAVTSHDFVFALGRIFSAGRASPFAEDFAAVKNARAVLDGALPAGELGIAAVDDYTLTITLEQRSPFFLHALASTAAMPCNRDNFEQSRGRYGLEKQFVPSNGPFFLDGWTENLLTLRPNPNYNGEGELPSSAVYLDIGKEDPAARFFAGDTDFIRLADFAAVQRAREAGAQLTGHQTTTWAIVFNQNDPVWGNPFMRQGLAYAADRSDFEGRLPENLAPTSYIIPPAAMLADKSFRTLAPAPSPMEYDAQRARHLFAMGMEQLGLDALPATDLYVPVGSGHAANMGIIQSSWQNTLGVYINIAAIPPEEISERLGTGDFRLMLMPIVPENEKAHTALNFSRGRFGYNNPRVDELISYGINAADLNTAVFRISQAERTLLADAVAIPAYHETTYFAAGKDAHGATPSPFGGMVYFGG